MKKPSDARQRKLALQARAIRFSNQINQTYPSEPMNYPSEVVWEQLVRASDSASNNLVEAGDGGSDADFLHKMRTALREARESKTCLKKIRMGPLANAVRIADLRLEQEADELCAIFSTIITNMEKRLAREKDEKRRKRE
jgi:four helix bundle protein